MLNWNDTLLGVEVTPELALREGWLIETQGGRWQTLTPVHTNDTMVDYEVVDGEIVSDGICCSDRSIWSHSYGTLAETRPIFPPRGWAGLPDAELWDAIWSIECALLCRQPRIEIDSTGVYIQNESGGVEYAIIGHTRLADTILALQNVEGV